MFHVSEMELEELATGYASLDQMLCGIVAGVLVTSGAVIMTVTLDVRMTPIFVAVAFVSLIMTLFFGGRVFLEHRRTTQRVKGIKQQHTVHGLHN